MEWRHFMDYQFAQVLADLTRYTNKLDPLTPAGFVGRTAAIGLWWIRLCFFMPGGPMDGSL